MIFHLHNFGGTIFVFSLLISESILSARRKQLFIMNWKISPGNHLRDYQD